MSVFKRNPGFARLFFASSITNLGDGVSVLAFPWLASLITRDPFLISLVGFATRLPWLLFTLPAGVITDRANRLRLIVNADLLRFVLTALVVGVILVIPEFPPAQPGLWIAALAALAFCLGSAEVLRDNAAQTLLPSIVRKEDLEVANGRLWTIEHIMGHFVGPPLAGVLIALALPLPFALDAVSFLVAALLILRIPVTPRAARPLRKPREEVAEAWSWLKAHPVILRLAVMLGFMNLISMMSLTLIVLISQDILGLDAAQHGLLLAVAAFGGVAGGLWGPKVIGWMGNQISLFVAIVLIALGLALIALTNQIWVVAMALFVESFAALLWNIVTVSYRQRVIPDDLLGRVNSVYRFFGWGGAPIGALLAGVLVSVSEPALGREMALRLPYMLGAGGMGVILIYALRRLRL